MTMPIDITPKMVQALERGANCTRCQLGGCGRGPVPSIVRPGAKVAASGEAPGVHEVGSGENFVWKTGAIVDECLYTGGQSRWSTTLINAAACQPPPGEALEDYLAREARKVKRGEHDLISPLVACRARFELDLDEAAPLAYLAIGRAALSEMEQYLRSRFAYTGDELVMARMHGAPVLLATPRQSYAAAIAEAERLATLHRDMEPDDFHAAAPERSAIDRAIRAIERSAQFHGWDAQRFLFASYHPAFAMPGRSPKWMRTVKMNLTRATDVATRGWINWAEPKYLIAPPVEAALAWLEWARTTGAEVVVDLETCRAQLPPEDGAGRPSVDQHRCAIRTIGIGVRDPTVPASASPAGAWKILVLPFRHMDGSLWDYAIDQRAQLADASRRLFDSAPLIGHNFVPFDSEIMLRPSRDTLGVGDHALLSDRTRIVEDTRVLHHNTPAQDMPHTLSFLGRERFEVPEWKSKEDVTSTDNADDGKLMLRCARDVYVTGLVAEPLRRDVERAGTVPQHETDRQVARILRDMSELGMCIDERERGKMSEILNRECARLRGEWVELVGRDVNPRSVPQMQTLLYEDWGIEPPLSTDGDVWNPEKDDVFEADEGSTGAAALLMIADGAHATGQLGNASDLVTMQRRLSAVEKALEYRALDKPRGSYCDNTDVRPWPGPRPDGVWRLAARGALPERDALSWVRATWAIPVTPVGRSVCKDPGLQQVPQLGREIPQPDDSKWRVNMRRMYVAAPGHVFIYSDYNQSHVRISYAVAGMKRGYDTLAQKLNPHIMHMAALLADTPAEIRKRYDWIMSLPKDDKEYWKLVSKKFYFGTLYNPRFIYSGGDTKAYHTVYRVMKKERHRSDGRRMFPNLKLSDCSVWEDRLYASYPEAEAWQMSAIARYNASGYAMSPILDQRKRFGPLDLTMIGNHEILAFEGSLKNRAMITIDREIGHRRWSEWSGLVGDFHDALLVQAPEARAKEGQRIVGDAMKYHWRDMQFDGEPKIVRSYGG